MDIVYSYIIGIISLIIIQLVQNSILIGSCYNFLKKKKLVNHLNGGVILIDPKQQCILYDITRAKRTLLML